MHVILDTILSNYQTGQKTRKLSVLALAKKFSIHYTTLYKQINKWVTGYEHRSGGKRNSRILPKQHEGKLNHWTCLQYGI